MNTVEWLEQFTGQKVATGASTGVDPLAATEAFEKEQALKLALLAAAHKRVAPLKAQFQQAMSSEVKIKGKLFKQRMLEVRGTQIDEAEYEEIDFSAIQLEPETQKIIAHGSNLIALEGEQLAGVMTDRDGTKQKLFTPVELEDGYWFPLTRERILPETFIGKLYSKTQRMLDETNALYLAEVERKREKGELTPKANRVKDLVQTGVDLLTLSGDMVAAFGPGTEGAQLAVTVLKGSAQVISGAGDAYDKLKAREYADGATAALGSMQILTKMVLSSVGIDKNVVDIVDKSFTAGGKAITVGKHFARGVDGAADGVNVFADMLGVVLSLAATNSPKDSEVRRNLELAAVGAPNSMRAASTSVKLLQALDKGDVDGVIDCIGEYSSTALKTVQGVKAIEETRGKSDKEAQKITEGLDKETERIQGYIDLGTAAGKTTVAMALAAKRGNYQAMFDKLVDSIGANLGKALTSAGLPEDLSKKISLIYSSASSGVKALQCLIEDVQNVEGVLRELSKGFGAAFEAFAPKDSDLAKIGAGVAEGLSTLAGFKSFYDKVQAGDFDGALSAFTGEVMGGLDKVFEKAGVTAPKPQEGSKSKDEQEGGEEDEEGDKDEEGDEEEGDESGEGDKPEASDALKQALLKLGVSDKNADKLIAEHIDDALEAEVDKQTRAQAEEEAQAILEEAKAELSDPEKFARDASNIDELIQKMLRDQMIMKIALQIMQGGTAFLATFIPGLGAAPAAIKMMASMVTAAQRAQQLAYWVNSQKDLEAAQSALSSSAQNFVRNQAEQFTHHTIQAAFAAAEMIGQVLRVAGAATYGAMEAAGAGLVVAAKAGAKLEEIVRRHYKTEALEAAWRLTKRSIQNPNNRKLGLRARAQNPTLAKYSIAWGAVHLKDALARDALRACNLTEAVLENENANVDKVVLYLETFYEEDDKLYREVEEAAPWLPKDLSLTLRCWVKVKKAAVDEAKLANPDTGALDGLLALLKGDVSQKGPVEQQERVDLLQSIDRALAAYTPEIADAKKLKAMQGAIALLRKQGQTMSKAIVAAAEKKRKDKEAEDEKAQQERSKLLEVKDNVLTELKSVAATLAEFDLDDDELEMQIGYAEALRVIKEISGLTSFKQDGDVQTQLKTAALKARDLDNLIQQKALEMA